MATRVTTRALAGLLLLLAVLASVLLLARSVGSGGAVLGVPGAVTVTTGHPSATAGVPAATSKPDAATAGTTPTLPGSAAGDPCRLVTSTEVAAVLGRPVAKVQPRQGFLLRSCVFSGARGDRQVIVQLSQGPAASQAQFRMGRRPDDQPVAGVGDEAWFTPDTCLLDVRQGSARFQVGLLDVTGQAGPRRAPPGLVTLARVVARRV